MSAPLAEAAVRSLVRRYDEAWAERDPTRRLASLADIWADDAIYVDPDVPDGTRGRQALADLIDASVSEMPGLVITATGDVAVLADRAWYRWRATTDSGPAFEGTDFIEVGGDGRIARVTTFFDP